MSKKKVLIVEDEVNIAELVKYNLVKNGFNCEIVSKGEDALITLSKQNIDLIILDLMLPWMDGLEACRMIKRNEKTSTIPIIMLTAKGEETDRIVGFELGAIDYVVKPFSPRELVLRVKAIMNLHKSADKPEDVLRVDKLEVNIPKHKVTFDGNEVKLTSMEFKLLVILIQRMGRVQSRDALLNDIWDIAADVTTRTIDTHVKCLRQKLGEVGKLIETVRGLGYKFRESE